MSTYGRACAACTKAKCRCVYPGQGDVCERCHRLNKNCEPSETAKRRSGIPAKRASSRTAPLEAKLDRLVDLLESQRNRETLQEATQVFSPAPSTSSLVTPGHGPSVTTSEDGALGANSSNSSASTLKSPPRTDDSSFSSSQTQVLPSPGEPSASEAEEYLHTFRTHMLPFFPVLHLRAEATSQQLRDDRPFLWLCIMAVACPCTSQQLALGDSVRQLVAREVVYKSQKSLEFLQGLLVFTAWIQYQVRYMASVSTLMQLATSLVFDLGLNKAIEERRGANCFRAAFQEKSPRAKPTTPLRRERTMEERRAVLGCFLVSSVLSTTLKRLDSLRWTPYMDECLARLSESPECPGDTTLAVQVKLQLIVEQADRSYCTWPFGSSLYHGSLSPTQIQLKSTHVDSLLVQLQRIEDGVPKELSDNDVIRCQVHTTRLMLNETLLHTTEEQEQPPRYRLDLERTGRSSACLHALTSWFDAFLALPPPSYVGLTFHAMCAMAYAFLTLARFSTTDDLAWDKGVVGGTVDLLAVCDGVVGGFESVVGSHRSPPSDEDVDFFADAARAFRFMRRKWQREMGKEESAPGDNGEGVGMGIGVGDGSGQAGGDFAGDLSMYASSFALEWMDAPCLIDFLSSSEGVGGV